MSLQNQRAVKPDREALSSNIRAFFTRNDIRGAFEALNAGLPSGARLMVFGGAIRNRLIGSIHGTTPPIEDIDVLVGNIDPAFRLQELALSGRLHTTELGGIRWHPPSVRFSFDICLLKKFIILEKFNLKPSLKNLMAAVDFDVNAVVLDLGCRAVYEKNCITAIIRRTMDLNSPMVYDKSLLAYRILVVRYKIDFMLSERLFRFVREKIDLDTMRVLKSALVSKTGQTRAALVIKDYDRICRCSGYGHYRKRYAADHPNAP